MSPQRELDPESSPAARFGFELRKRRVAADLTQEALGDVIKYTPALISMIENGHRLPTADFVHRCDAVFGLDGTLHRLWQMCRSDTAKKWFVPWLEIEQTASMLYAWEHSLVPGLLQIPDYARALFLGMPRMRPLSIDDAVTARIERQAVFERERPPMLCAVLDEVVLQRPVGGAAVMREQLEHLLTVAEHPCITLQIVPLQVGCTAGLGGAFVLAHVHGHDLAYLDSTVQGAVTALPGDVEEVRVRHDAVRAAALSQDASAELIKEWVQRWTS
ncbi:helix-turn-helix transcriptional regulator [Sphaerisporangium sp. TRM90804]|uniref:helix-turn-helix domain-containing protein n=1 Tax=Sphaerisporangium sp. TRM90804 TaxID=3031113 RepID=UPI002447FE01|nr:helix-turn-helix transcriptional regulator [Sphaerisporangium sp. TRM90804]MDH2425896.1 helix-turn-helix transcriptional regulator [Sphaerisporangium sp. TRM90804]